VRRLKQELDPQTFVQHPQVKLLAAVMEGIKERIAADPYASRFALTGPLRRYGRLKGLGLPATAAAGERPSSHREVRSANLTGALGRFLSPSPRP
jgi:hypothetical protein